MSQFDSAGARAEGTMRIAALRSWTNSSPTEASSDGAGVRRQVAGNCFIEIVFRETPSGTSAVTTTRSFGGSSASMWTKYSIIASERCSNVYARRTPTLEQRPRRAMLHIADGATWGRGDRATSPAAESLFHETLRYHGTISNSTNRLNSRILSAETIYARRPETHCRATDPDASSRAVESGSILRPRARVIEKRNGEACRAAASLGQSNRGHGLSVITVLRVPASSRGALPRRSRWHFDGMQHLSLARTLADRYGRR